MELVSGAGSCGRKLSTTQFERLRPAVATGADWVARGRLVRRRQWGKAGPGPEVVMAHLGPESKVSQRPEPSRASSVVSPLPCLFVNNKDIGNHSSSRGAWPVYSLLEDQLFQS